MEIFLQTFKATLAAIAPVFIIIILAGLLVRRKIISQDNVKAFARLTVTVLLPCLMISKITNKFKPGSMPGWWLLPLVSAGMIFVGILLAWFFFRKGFARRKNMAALCSIQNSIYFILAVGSSLYSGAELDSFVLYTFLFALSSSPLIWSLGKYMATDSHEHFKWRSLLTPPLISNLTALLIVFLNLRSCVPVSLESSLDVINKTISMIGQAATPMANIVLGATLGGLSLKLKPYRLDAAKVIAVKLILLPAITIAVLYFTKIGQSNPILAKFLILEAAVAPASAIIMQIRHYGGDEQKVSSIMLLSYIVSIITIPTWMALWQLTAG
ncbi:MAG: AEC family transporter [Phycisphaerae bacterium]|nr:AEC family transporter [Phycisphaerae bacterium]